MLNPTRPHVPALQSAAPSAFAAPASARHASTRPADSAERPAVATAALRLLPWIFGTLGVLAPLVLVAAAALGSDAAPVRAQMIVQGCELLVTGLVFTVVLGLLYALDLREPVVAPAAAAPAPALAHTSTV